MGRGWEQLSAPGGTVSINKEARVNRTSSAHANPQSRHYSSKKIERAASDRGAADYVIRSGGGSIVENLDVDTSEEADFLMEAFVNDLISAESRQSSPPQAGKRTEHPDA